MGFTTQLPAAQEYVYVIHATGTNRIKLGFSIRPQERLAQLQTGSPFPLQILACWPSSQEQEQQLHRHFAEFRCVGEWFEVPPFCGLKIYELAAKGGATGSVQAISSAVLEGKRRYRKSGLPSVEACKGSVGTWNIRLRWYQRQGNPVRYCCTISNAEYEFQRTTRWKEYKQEIIERYAANA